MSDDNKVICQACIHEFAAVPVSVQEQVARLTAENGRLIDAGELRLCLTCGKTKPASEPREVGLPGCEDPEYGSLCLFDATPQEAFLHWRQIAHDQQAEIERLRAELAAERERCKDLVRRYMPAGWSAVYDAMADGRA